MINLHQIYTILIIYTKTERLDMIVYNSIYYDMNFLIKGIEKLISIPYFLRFYYYLFVLPVPVEPNPPIPLTVSDNSSTSIKSTGK